MCEFYYIVHFWKIHKKKGKRNKRNLEPCLYISKETTRENVHGHNNINLPMCFARAELTTSTSIKILSKVVKRQYLTEKVQKWHQSETWYKIHYMILLQKLKENMIIKATLSYLDQFWKSPVCCSRVLMKVMHSSPILCAGKSWTYIRLNVEPRHEILKHDTDGFVTLLVFECNLVLEPQCPGYEFCTWW